MSHWLLESASFKSAKVIINFCSLFCFFLFSQPDLNIKEISRFTLPYYFNMGEFNFNLSANNVVFCEKEYESADKKICIINLNSKKKEVFEPKIKGLHSVGVSSDEKNILVASENFYHLIDRRAKHTKDSINRYLRKREVRFPNLFHADIIQQLNDSTWVLTDNYCYRYLPEKNFLYQPYINFLKIRNNMLVLEDTVPFMIGKEILYSLLVGSYIDVCGNKMIIGNASKSSFQMIDLITRERKTISLDTPQVYINTDTFNLGRYGWNYKNIIYDLKILDTKISRFEKFFLSDDSTLYASYKPANSGFEYRYLFKYRIRNDHACLVTSYLLKSKKVKFIRTSEQLFNITNSDPMKIKNDNIFYVSLKIPWLYLLRWNNWLFNRYFDGKINQMLYVYKIK